MLRAHSATPARRAVLSLLIVLSGYVLAGCGSSSFTAERTHPLLSSTRPVADVEPLLREEVERWRGTPHALGGTTSAGLDCSAFVQRVFADALAVDLPRTTEQQVTVGRRVNMSELRSGDLVFFQPPTKTNHVGIYLDDGEFAHVSSSAGVTISELGLEYWRSSYWTSRRVLEDEVPLAVRPVHLGEARPPGTAQTDDSHQVPMLDADEADERNTRAPHSGRRVGW